MDNNNLLIEINKLKALIVTLQQLQRQQTEINSVKETALNTHNKVISHWHFVGTDTTNKTFFT